MRAAMLSALLALASAACASSAAPPSDTSDGPLGTHLSAHADGGLPPGSENPRPKLVDLAPRSLSAGAPDTTVRLLSSDFSDAGVVFAQGPGTARIALKLLSRADDLLFVSMPAGLVATPGPIEITLRNPPPGGGDSAPLTLTVEPPFVAPKIEELLPRTVPPQAQDLELAVRGRALDPRGSVWALRLGGTDAAVMLATTLRTTSEWHVTVPSRLLLGPAALVIRFETPSGARSNDSLFDVGDGGFLTLARVASPSLAVTGDAVFAAIPGTGANGGSIVKAPFDGSGVVVLASALPVPGDVAVLGDALFWPAIGGEALSSVPLLGGQVATALTSPGLAATLAAADGHLFWAAGGVIHRALPDGREETRFVACAGCERGGLWAGDGGVFWASPTSGSVTRIPLDAPAASPATPLLLGSGLVPERVAADESHLWIASGGLKTGLWRCDLDGGNLTRIADGPIGGLAVNDGVYWTSRDRLYRLTAVDPAPAVVAEGIGLPIGGGSYGAVALTSTHVAWSTESSIVALPRRSAGVTDRGLGLITTGGCSASPAIPLTVGAAPLRVFAVFASASDADCAAPEPASVSWTLDDPAFAQLSTASGVTRLTGLAVGTTTLRAHADGFDAAVTLHVALAPGSFLADACPGSAELLLPVGQSKDVSAFLGLRGTACDAYSLDLSWISSAPNVIGVVGGGPRATLRATSDGSATLLAVGPGFSAQLAVHALGGQAITAADDCGPLEVLRLHPGDSFSLAARYFSQAAPALCLRADDPLDVVGWSVDGASVQLPADAHGPSLTAIAVSPGSAVLHAHSASFDASLPVLVE